MSYRRYLLTAAATLALTACATSTPSTTRELTADSLLNQSFSVRGGSTVDMNSFFSELPSWLNASFSDAKFSASTGAMIVDNLTLSLTEAPDYKLVIEQAQFWGADNNALNAVMNGNVTDLPVEIFDRASFENIRTEGLSWDNGKQSANNTIDKIVIDGLSAKSFSLTPIEAQEGEEIITLVRTLAGVASSYSIDAMAYSGWHAEFKESFGGRIDMDIARGFMSGYDRGRKAYEISEGFSFRTIASSAERIIEVDNNSKKEPTTKDNSKILQPWAQPEIKSLLKNPIAFITQYSGGQRLSQTVTSIESRNTDISGALKWLTKWQLPPITETNLIDFGSFTTLDNRQTVDDEEIFVIARSEVTDTKFYWLIPSKIRQVDSGYNVNLLALAENSLKAEGLDLQNNAELKQVRDAMITLGLDNIRGGSEAEWNWNGETGVLNTNASLNLIDSVASDFALDMGGPSLASWKTLIENNTNEEEILKALNLSGFRFSLTDDQLLDRIYTLAAEQLGNGSGEDLRQSLPSLIRLGSGQFNQLSPRIPLYVDALSGFTGDSGTITITAKPEAPVSLQTISEMGETTPQALLDLLNVEIVHTPE